jgi:SAM-dependent methyltransferase
MSSDKRWVLKGVEAGDGVALDLGGGPGELARPLEQLGYTYVNVDLEPAGAHSVVGNAEALPFPDCSCSLVLSSDTLEHFRSPANVLDEARRVLKPGGRIVVWVPFMHPFHGDDRWRYTPLGLRELMNGAGFDLERLESPLAIFSLAAQMGIAVAQRIRLERFEPALERAAARLDARMATQRDGPAAFATAYLVVARRPAEISS